MNDSISKLTCLLEENETFSFLRLGDGELKLLLNIQQSGAGLTVPELRASCEVAFAFPALGPEHYHRLLRAYERCGMIDTYAYHPFNRAHLRDLKWHRAPNLPSVCGAMEGFIIKWAARELKGWVQRHRCIICGAEAALLRELLKDEQYRAMANPFWPTETHLVFVQPRRNGAFLSEDLDVIKHDLKVAVLEYNADTIFLSLGGAAKIIGHELSEELGVRAIDLGAVLRGLTFSGSDGHATWRSAHHPFMLRVPFRTYMDALERAHPDVSLVTLLAKAHAQLCLEFQCKQLLRSHTSDVSDESKFENSPANRARFDEGIRLYRKRYKPLARSDSEAVALVREFDYWCLKKGLGWRGKIFRLFVVARGVFRSFARSIGGKANKK